MGRSIPRAGGARAQKDRAEGQQGTELPDKNMGLLAPITEDKDFTGFQCVSQTPREGTYALNSSST